MLYFTVLYRGLYLECFFVCFNHLVLTNISIDYCYLQRFRIFFTMQEHSRTN